ncbi:hypothetical protein ANANG_G00151230 [Anguilla anguilla]|uniref:Uncharacterized protein n=1 Tax=Anguilla anguilla TaxID=7936 RepID=A0A9D3RUI4_ANGAN|nr:hypothetical protein ANANG_G00151230 [Anguilla anguilla]
MVHVGSLSLYFLPPPPGLDGWPPAPVTMSTISPTDFDSLEIQQQYNDINNRWDLAAESDWDNENSSARLFERSRIKALAGRTRPLSAQPRPHPRPPRHSTLTSPPH